MKGFRGTGFEIPVPVPKTHRLVPKTSRSSLAWSTPISSAWFVWTKRATTRKKNIDDVVCNKIVPPILGFSSAKTLVYLARAENKHFFF